MAVEAKRPAVSTTKIARAGWTDLVANGWEEEGVGGDKSWQGTQQGVKYVVGPWRRRRWPSIARLATYRWLPAFASRRCRHGGERPCFHFSLFPGSALTC